MTETQIYPGALARLFSSTVVQQLARRGESPLASRLLKESGILDHLDERGSFADAFQTAFQFLKSKSNRHEYIYKAAITHKILLGRHNLNTASMLTEFRVGKCKADVVVLNGTGAVYEIKSERDTLTRLPSQLSEYLKVFAVVNVITGANHLKDVLELTPSDVGIMVLSDSYTISTHRDPVKDVQRTCPLAIFDALSLRESETLLKKAGFEIPPVPNTLKYCTLRSMFEHLTPTEAHQGMVETLKISRKLSPLKSLINEVPDSLQAAALSTKFRKCDHSRFSDSLKVSLQTALSWG